MDGAFLAIRAAIRHVYSRGRGSIIYMSSGHSREAPVLKAPYVTARHEAVDGEFMTTQDVAKAALFAHSRPPPSPASLVEPRLVDAIELA